MIEASMPKFVEKFKILNVFNQMKYIRVRLAQIEKLPAMQPFVQELVEDFNTIIDKKTTNNLRKQCFNNNEVRSAADKSFQVLTKYIFNELKYTEGGNEENVLKSPEEIDSKVLQKNFINLIPNKDYENKKDFKNYINIITVNHAHGHTSCKLNKKSNFSQTKLIPGEGSSSGGTKKGKNQRVESK
uniref:Uncharacterized protein n=1 Tax=Meloidogyne hapla TaxID=6305 RepID=A0A1I8BK40_MELHA